MENVRQALSAEQELKTREDLQVIDKLSKTAPKLGMRVIIGGGYAVDGFLGKITRPHNDIDIQIYGVEDSSESAIERLLDAIAPSEFEYTTKDKGRSEYYHNLLYHFGPSVLDIYYIQTKTSPFGKEKHIVKSNGEIDEQVFPEPVFGRIEDISFEIQNPEVELKDKIYKRKVRRDVKRSEHEQDIENLRKALNNK